MQTLRNWFVLLVITSGVIVNYTTCAYAEGGSDDIGNGVLGANRRVASETGFSKIEVEFTEPMDFSTPSTYRTVNGKKEYIIGSNWASSKPSFYIGTTMNRLPGIDGAETDAGVQWEFETPIAAPYPGWSIFLSWDHADDKDGDGDPDKFTSIRRNGAAWRAARGELGTVTLTSEPTQDGAIKLNTKRVIVDDEDNVTNDEFANYWDDSRLSDGVKKTTIFPISTNGNITQEALNNMFVKRVTAITQDVAARMDGSFMNNVTSTTIAIYKGSINNGTLTHQVFSGFPETYVEHSRTKYTPTRADGTKRWAIDFDFEGMNTPSSISHRGPNHPTDKNGSYRNLINDERYTKETVHINLKLGPGRFAGIRAKGGAAS